MKVIKGWIARNTIYASPYYLVHGSAIGETVVVTAGVHGNEPAGVHAARRLLVQLRTKENLIQRGTLLIVPLVNQEAFQRNVRGTIDLNRTFPIDPGSRARHPLTADLFRLAKLHGAAWYLDLHEANGLSQLDSTKLGQTLIVNPGSIAIPALRRTAARINQTIPLAERHFQVRIKALAGSGRHAAHHLLHARAVTVETCWSLPLNDRIAYQSEMMSLLLKEAGL